MIIIIITIIICGSNRPFLWPITLPRIGAPQSAESGLLYLFTLKQVIKWQLKDLERCTVSQQPPKWLALNSRLRSHSHTVMSPGVDTVYLGASQEVLHEQE